MSRIHNMLRLVGDPGTEEFEAPKGLTLVSAHYIGLASDQEKTAERAAGYPAGDYKMLYVFTDEVKAGRPKNE